MQKHIPDRLLQFLFPNSPYIRNSLIGIYDEGNSSYANCIFQLLFHLKPICSFEFPPEIPLRKISQIIQHYTGQSAISIQFFFKYIENKFPTGEPKDPIEFLTIILKHIDSDFLKIDIFKKYLDDQKVEFYDNLSFIELSIGSNNDRYFSTLKQSMDDYFGTPQNGKTEEGYDNVFFNYKISYMTDYVLIKLRRFIKNNTITTHIRQPLKIPTMINFRNYMMKEEETIYKIKAIIFYQKSRKTTGHFVDLIYIKKNWVLFNNEKVSFPEYQKKHINILNDAIKTGAYLLLYKKTEKHQFVNEILCLHHKGINSSEQIQQDEINSSEQINPLNSETEPNFIVVRHGGVYENTFILSSMFDDLLGILSVNPVGAPESPIGEFEMSNTLFGIFIRTISKQLANKVF